MKPAMEQFEVQSTMVGERIAMDIDAESTVHLMGILTDLYKDRLLAVVREYATNAWDAHIEARITLPIEVTLPTLMAPTLVIRDYGSGLDAEGIRTIYSRYGASTKRATDDQAGMLGLGCKAALTYTSQLTVTSVKDGVRLIVLVSRDEHGQGSMQILSQAETDDTNGTEIAVAIRREDQGRCESLARDFFSYWKPGTVLLDGAEPRSFAEDALKISDDLYVVENMGSESMIVMGQVPYPHKIDLGLSDRSTRLVAFVPIGAVRPVPSREALMDTKNTKDAVDKIVKEYHDHIAAAIQTEIDNAATPQDAIKALVGWEQYVPKSAPKVFTYQGQTIPKEFKLPDTTSVDSYARPVTIPTRILVASYRTHYRENEHEWPQSIPVRLWPDVVWVYGFLPEKFTGQHKKKLREWVRVQGISCEKFVLLRGAAPISPFIDSTYIWAWEDVRKVKLTAASGYYPDKQIPGSYKAYTEAKYIEELPGKDIRQNKPIFYGQGNEHFFGSISAALRAFYPEFTLVCLQANRVAKFERDVPKAIDYLKAVNTGYAAWAKQIDSKDLIALEMHDTHMVDEYKVLDAARIDDPELAELVRMSHRDVSALSKRRRSFARVVNTSTLSVKVTNLLEERYPLYDRCQAKHKHTYIYLNHIYALLKEEQNASDDNAS